MIDAFAADGQYRTAYGVFQQLKAVCLRPYKMTYTTLINTGIKGGDLDNALELLGRPGAAGCRRMGKAPRASSGKDRWAQEEPIQGAPLPGLI